MFRGNSIYIYGNQKNVNISLGSEKKFAGLQKTKKKSGAVIICLGNVEYLGLL